MGAEELVIATSEVLYDEAIGGSDIGFIALCLTCCVEQSDWLCRKIFGENGGLDFLLEKCSSELLPSFSDPELFPIFLGSELERNLR